jgi:hypothetical protein
VNAIDVDVGYGQLCQLPGWYDWYNESWLEFPLPSFGWIWWENKMTYHVVKENNLVVAV